MIAISRALSLFLIAFVPWPALAEPVRITLSEALERGKKSNGEILSELQKVEQAKADIARVDGEFGPKIEGTAGLGPMTAARGNALNSIESRNDIGAVFLGSLELTQPIFTWGRKAAYQNAAEHGRLVSVEGVRAREIEVSYQIKEAYYGALYALSLKDFIKGGLEDLEKVEKEMKKITKEDKFRLEIFRAQVEGKAAEVDKGLALARAALRLRTGSKEAIEPKEEWIEAEEREHKDLQSYIAMARVERPEFRQLEAGIVAKSELARAERKGDLPVVAILAKYDFAYTSKRENQSSVFAYDPYNQDSMVFGLGLKWNFQWGLQTAKADKYAAEAVELEAKGNYANAGIPVAVEKAWQELLEAETKLGSALKANKAAKRWLSGAMMGAGSGLGDARKIVDAYQARALTQKDYLEAVYRHHMAWAELSRAVGREVDPLLAQASAASVSR